MSENNEKIRIKHKEELQILDEEKNKAIEGFDAKVKMEIKELRRREQFMFKCIELPDFKVTDDKKAIMHQRQILELILLTLQKRFSSIEI